MRTRFNLIYLGLWPRLALAALGCAVIWGATFVALA
jgi:hypothetical protein